VQGACAGFIRSGGHAGVDWALRIDTLTAVMLVVVNTVSALVHIYSIGYMQPRPASGAVLRLPVAVHLRHADAGDGGQPAADVLRLGRRGLASYLLIGFWYKKPRPMPRP
jgi:NADH-quinone oxidoreductase subunit L